eukprot:259895-Pyramimonas_sp.AAC.1
MGNASQVTRDRMMKTLDEMYPVYGFAKHKGYGTAVHVTAIRKHGPCIEHRWSFAPVKGSPKVEGTPIQYE